MSFKKITLVFVALLSFAVIVFAILPFTPIEKLKSALLDEQILHSLTGLPGTDGPVLVVKIDDTSAAHPQVGLRSADVIYIEQVEGGLTRLAAVFSSEIPAIVGPVRSARVSDLELLAQYGTVGFAFSGAQQKFLPEIAKANLIDLGAMKFGPSFYTNDVTRVAPYAMMLKAPALLTEAKIRGSDIVISKPMGWSFGEAPTGMRKFSSVRINWPAASYEASWSQTQKRWLLTHNGKPNLDETGNQLGSPTFVIQMVEITDSIYKDKLGGVTPFSATVGSGTCYLLRDGGYFPCLWSRSEAASGTQFTDVSGQTIHFAPGQIWFALTDKEPIFTPLAGEDAASGASK